MTIAEIQQYVKDFGAEVRAKTGARAIVVVLSDFDGRPEMGTLISGNAGAAVCRVVEKALKKASRRFS